ncbi:MAG: SH3 domain-containing protein [Lachnospiraceae bacterium]|nr:SH3 domain-containing protein [Lachnospiraceae bacterium]
MDLIKKTGLSGILKYIFLAAVIVTAIGFASVHGVHAEEDDENWVYYVGVANGTVNVRSGPGVEYDQITDATNEKIKLSAQEEVTIIGESPSSEGKIWYNIKFERGGILYKGYVTSSYVSKDESRTITPSPTPSPTPTPSPAPTPTEAPTEVPSPTPVPDDNEGNGTTRDEIFKIILIVIVIAILILVGLIVYKLLRDRKSGSEDAASRKVDRLKKLNLDNRESGRKVPQIKRLDVESSAPEEVRQDVYYKNSYDSGEDDLKRNAEKDTDERRALRAAIDRLQEHDIVYHTTYGEGEVFDNSDVKLIEVRFGNDMRFLKKDQLVAKRELLIIDEEDQSIAKRRNKRRTNK